ASVAVSAFMREAGKWAQKAHRQSSNMATANVFGYSVGLSAGGQTLAVGAIFESNSAIFSGAVYVFIREAGNWSQQAYIKASPTAANSELGYSVNLSADGQTLAVGAVYESSSAIGINGDQTNSGAATSGAVYVFTREAGSWSQQAYIKASNTAAHNFFGHS